MIDYVKPKVLVSKCIGFESCRFNGGIISSEVVENLKNFVEFEPVCPEVEIGLGTPRKALRLVEKDGGVRLIQSETRKDYKEEMESYAANLFSELNEIDGAILKNRSPSCGTNDVKLYADLDKSGVLKKVPGLFGGAVVEEYPLKPVENEGRLRNFRIREDFYTDLFALARFRKHVLEDGSIKALTDYQANNKFLLMTYDQETMREMGKIAANPEDEEIERVIEKYQELLTQALSESPSPGGHVNTLEHSFGYFSDELSSQEKSLFKDYIEDYREGKVPLSTLISLVRSWIVRFDEEYLKEQRYFDPYPSGLVEISDSGKGRDY
ncbi:MAG: YbgA family protein [Candidatus Bipolaricaulota bacterium]